MEVQYEKKIVSLCLILALLSSLWTVPTTVNAEENSLAPYFAVLEELNKELGTDYTFPSTEQMKDKGERYDELVEFYTDMSIEEFRGYILEAYVRDVNEDESDSFTNPDIGNDEGIELLSSSKTQKYYYSASNSKYLYITSTVYTTSSGVTKYSSTDEYGSEAYSYPYYGIRNMSRTFSSNYKKVTCTFSCVKYVGNYLISAGTYTLKVTFTASGGNVYTTVTV